jgi:hypothetical protein
MSAPVWIHQAELLKHFRKHGHKLALGTVQEYEASALDTIQVGTRFTFEDPAKGRKRVGYYDKVTNRLTVVSDDELFILSHYPPDRGERYVRDRPGSTYR